LIFIYDSFRSSGIFTAALAKVNHQGTTKYFPSVSTEMPQAPAVSYPFTTSSTVTIVDFSLKEGVVCVPQLFRLGHFKLVLKESVSFKKKSKIPAKQNDGFF
jgi:hypothetical protein